MLCHSVALSTKDQDQDQDEDEDEEGKKYKYKMTSILFEPKMTSDVLEHRLQHAA